MFQLTMNQSKSRTEINSSICDLASQSRSRASSSLRTSKMLRSHKNLFDGCVGTFGTSSRGDLFASSVCSPAAKYKIKSGFQINLATKRGASISSSRSSLGKSNLSYIQKSSNPGPGAYHPEKPKSKKTIVIGLKNKNECKEIFLNENLATNYPGPSKYQTKQQVPSGGKIVTLSLRFDGDKQNKPGPGAYFKNGNLKIGQSPKAVFGCSQRKTFVDKAGVRSVSPGPGQYRIHSQFE